MLTQASGWGIKPDYLAVFRPESYRWLVPAPNDPTEASQMSMTLGAVFLIAVLICEAVPALRRRACLPVRLAIYFCAAVIYYLSVSGVACVDMESMLRYQFCAYTLIVLAFLSFLRPTSYAASIGAGDGDGGSGAGQRCRVLRTGIVIWNFTRGNWVA